MKFGVIIETKEHEKAWNGFRFATASKKNGHEVKVFLMGATDACPMSTMVDCVKMVEWADRVATF